MNAEPSVERFQKDDWPRRPGYAKRYVNNWNVDFAFNLFVLSIFTTCVLVGCARKDDVVVHQRDYPDGSVEKIALQTCRDWVPGNLELHGRSIDEYFAQVSVSNDITVYFLHRDSADEFMVNGHIVAMFGGFPDYFNVKLSTDGREVLGHYAEYY